MKELSIILVNYNNSEDTVLCLDSLQNILFKSYSIIIVDNYSNINDYTNLKNNLNTKKFNFTYELIRTDSNLGFAGGNNIGIKCALNKYKSKYLLLLNNDTIVEKDFLEPLVNKINEGYSMATSKVLFEGNKNLIWASGGYLNQRRGIGVNRNFKKKNKNINDDCEVNFAPFCCVLFNSDVFMKYGFMDESYFMYFEDVDYCIRLISKGLKFYYCHNSVIYHKVSASSGGIRSNFYLEWMTRNRKKIIKRYYNNIVYFEFLIETYIKIFIYFIKFNFKAIKAIKKGIKL